MAYEFSVSLKDQVSAAAASASAQVKTLETSMRGLQATMTKQQALGDLAGLQKSVSTFQALKASADALKGSIPAAIPPIPARTLTLLEEARIKLAKTRAEALAMSQAKSQVETFGESLAALAGPAKIAAVAVGAIVVAVGAMILKGAELAMEAGETKERMLALFDAMGQGKVSGQQTIDLLDSLRGKLGATREELAPLAQKFMAMGITDLPSLTTSLTAARSAFALTGQAGSDAFTTLSARVQDAIEAHSGLKLASRGLAKQFLEMGLAPKDVADKMGISLKEMEARLKAGTLDATKFGAALNAALIEKGKGPLEKLAGSFTVLKARFDENIKHLFEGVNTAPFTDALRSIVDLFDTNTATGKEMHKVIVWVFNDLYSTAGRWILEFAILFLDSVTKLERGADQVVRAMKPFAASFKTPEGAFMLSAALAMLGNAASFLGYAIEGVVGGLFVMVGIMTAAAAGSLALVHAVVSGGKAIYNEVAGWVTWGGALIKNFVQGLIDGLDGGTGLLVEAIKAMGNKAITALKAVLGIHSPSRVMFEVGHFTTRGFAQGMEQSVPQVSRSAAVMGHAAVAGASSSRGAVNDNARSRPSINVGGIVINGAGKDAEQITEEAVSLVFERYALAQGFG